MRKNAYTPTEKELFALEREGVKPDPAYLNVFMQRMHPGTGGGISINTREDGTGLVYGKHEYIYTNYAGCVRRKNLDTGERRIYPKQEKL